MTEEAAWQRLSALCATSEQCLYDMRRKMQSWDLPEGADRRLLQRLLTEGYVDEQRYARAFVHDKSQYNRWGRRRIEFELHRRGIADATIADALAGIADEENDDRLTELLKAKMRSVKARNDYERMAKLMRFAAQRGFAADEVQRCLRRLTNIEEDCYENP